MNGDGVSRRDFAAASAGALAAGALAAASTHAESSPGEDFSICVTCSMQYAASAGPPAHCPICEDERQYVGFHGQQWTTLAELRKTHKNIFTAEEPALTSIHTEPQFGIGQRAFLIQTREGNVLWDCVALLDDATIEAVRKLGGVQAIAVSHPHFYSTMVEWSRAFDNAPIHLHQDDEKWVLRPDRNIHFWKADRKELFGGVTLLHTPGHFAGFQVLHWRDGADRRGALMAGDQPQVCSDRRWVSFMYSYPNFIPLSAAAVEDVVRRLKPWAFERIYGAFMHRTVLRDGKEVVVRSARRYMKAVVG